ncbi:hypothetical protein KKHLCK_12120 [Candidatus Electrothrix laxa]
MRILLIHRYFWPDTPPYASMLRSIGKRLVDEGHEVSVLSTQPSYKKNVSFKKQGAREEIDGIKVYRFSLFREHGRHVIFRLINIASFTIGVFCFSLLKGRFDIIMASTFPPVVLGFAAAMAAKITGASFFYHCMDIHPEIGRISGEFNNPLVYNLLRHIDNMTCMAAKRVIVLSEDMKRSLMTRPNCRQDNIYIINNFPLPNYTDSTSSADSMLKSKGKFRVIFTGNLGRFQKLELFIEAMKELTHRPMIEMVFVGEGLALDTLQENACEMKNIRFFPHQNVSVVRKIIADADLGVVSLAKGIYQFAFPSKTMTYLVEGCPLLVVVEPESQLAHFVESSNIGMHVTPDQPKSIAHAIESIYLDEERKQRMSSAAKKIGDEMFSEVSVLETWTSLVNGAVSEHNDT